MNESIFSSSGFLIFNDIFGDNYEIFQLVFLIDYQAFLLTLQTSYQQNRTRHFPEFLLPFPTFVLTEINYYFIDELHQRVYRFSMINYYDLSKRDFYLFPLIRRTKPRYNKVLSDSTF